MQTIDELTKKELKQIEADDQAIQTILLGLPEDIYAAVDSSGSENRPPMLNKENYVPWSSRLLRYAKSRPNGKLILNSIINGPYVRRMILEPDDPNHEVLVNETFHVKTDDELTEKELKQIEADDQAIQTILLGLPEDIYAAVDSCETAQEIWLRVQQMMKGSNTGIQEKKAKLFNEWERFTSTDGESIESYYHRFLKLMNDLKRNKHFPKKIANYTQLYDFLKYNQKEVGDLKSKRLARTQDPLALMATSNNPYTFPMLHQDQPSFKFLKRSSQNRRLNPFGCAKLTMFIIMCKAYGCEPSVDLFMCFFNSFPGGKWLIFAKRPKKHISNLLPKVITSIEGWKGRFFFVQDSVVPANCSELLSKDYRWDTKNFMYAETNDDLTFLPMGPSLEFGTGYPSVLINTKPPIAKVGPTGPLLENIADLGDSLHSEKLMIHPGSVTARIRERKCRTREGSSKPPVKHKLVQGANSSSISTQAKAAALKDLICA
nr:hypothetical protein [Tanacetum cinerariifolium]